MIWFDAFSHVCQSSSSQGIKEVLSVFQREFETEKGAHRGWNY